jgi:hypothetical protein
MAYQKVKYKSEKELSQVSAECEEQNILLSSELTKKIKYHQ